MAKTFTHEFIKIPELKQVNTDNGRRYVTPDGKHYPSVTTILSKKAAPWVQAWRERVGEEEANRISRVAATRGTKIHKLCENALMNEDEDKSKLSILDQEMYNKFRPLLDDIDNIKSIEQKMYSDHLRLGGQADCIAEYNGKLSVIDFKTSRKRKTRSNCYDYFIQCSAYAIMFEERTGIPINQSVIIMAMEESDPAVFTATRDEFVPRLIEARDAYEQNL
mgnify:CR=1 FL=1|tara:strand:- start:686 stop:1348 length:663 start_codon:yes stop_codon:yes gene_type:complete